MKLMRRLFGDEYWEKISKSKMVSKQVRGLLDVFIMLVINLFIALSLQIAEPRWIFILIACFSFLIYLFVMLYYMTYDEFTSEKCNEDRNKLAEINDKLRICIEKK